MPVDPKGYYAVLGVTTSASATEIKRAFRRRAIQLHPDRNRSSHAVHMFLLLKEAYETLSNVSRRASYDIWETTDDPEFKEISIGDATKVTTMNVTLYKVAGGSLRIQPIPPDEFD